MKILKEATKNEGEQSLGCKAKKLKVQIEDWQACAASGVVEISKK